MSNITKPGSHHETDVVIIGAGPCGLFQVFELGLLDMQAHLIDNLDKIGGQCAELYPDKNLYDIPSRPAITGQELTNDLITQAEPFEPTYHLNQLTSKIDIQKNHIEVTTNLDTVIKCKSLVIAAGSGCFVPRKIPTPGLEEFENKNIFYSVKKRSDFEGKKILIAGGGDSALDYVMGFHKIASDITLIHRRKEFKAVQDSVNKVMDLVDKKEIKFNMSTIKKMTDNGKGQVDIMLDDETVIDSVDAIFPFFGLKIELGPIAEWGLNLENNLISVNTENFETSTPRIFAVGDICTYPGKLKLILSGFHEAALAAKKMFDYCHNDKKYVFRYTTSSKDIQEKLGVK
ncbi:MAG: NAD(P)/FAD-dependent oxidoreductase [alpha proteobacterium HIMB59]|nr:MAG: NAD(P)/FAD-dependent oxidoreductase [alpha proteobacterium HIMB59]|tara:strand:+ start:100 stop:1134 length:1035 start_codon:yes stop_codon:yes gene_type:complete